MALKRILPSRVLSDVPSDSAAPAPQKSSLPPPPAAEHPAPTPLATIKADVERAAALLAASDDAVFAPPMAAPPAAVAAEPAAPTPSRPDNAHVLRRRDTRARHLNLQPSSAAASENAAQPDSAAEAAPAAQSTSYGVPINTTPLDKVDDTLTAAGVIAQAVDPLDKTAPQAAETEAPMPAALEPMPTTEVAAPASFNVASAALPPAVFAQEATAAAPLENLPPAPSASDVPWAAKPVPDAPLLDTPPTPHEPAKAPAAPNGWSMGGDAPPTALTSASAGPDISAPPASTLDLFKPLSATAPTPVNPVPLATRPGMPAPTLHSYKKPGGGGMAPLFVGAGAVALALLGAYWWVGRGGEAPHIAVLTENLKSTLEPAVLPPPTDAASAPNVMDINMGGGVSPSELGGGLLPPPTSTASIEFADVPPNEAGKPIVADGTETMPDEVGVIAKFQQAIAAEKAKQRGEVVPEPTAEQAASRIETPTERERDSTQLQSTIQEELAAYRKALAEADSVASSPKPSAFFGNPKAYMGKAPNEEAAVTASTSGDVSGSMPDSTSGMLPPPDLYTNNPNNLPVMGEPTAAEAQKIRTLEDFDVSAFEPETDRVRIPRGIKPRVSLSGFPQMDVLSFVPGKGVIAFHDGTEGVLLIGESLEGWELVNVTPDNAEFRMGNKTNYVSAE